MLAISAQEIRRLREALKEAEGRAEAAVTREAEAQEAQACTHPHIHPNPKPRPWPRARAMAHAAHWRVHELIHVSMAADVSLKVRSWGAHDVDFAPHSEGSEGNRVCAYAYQQRAVAMVRLSTPMSEAGVCVRVSLSRSGSHGVRDGRAAFRAGDGDRGGSDAEDDAAVPAAAGEGLSQGLNH